MERCGLCDEVISSGGGYLGEKGLETILKISRDIDDGLADKLLKKTIPIPIHSGCRNTYTKPSTVRAKRKRLDSQDQQSDRSVRRSQVPQFNFRTQCFYCPKVVACFENCSESTPDDLNSKLAHSRRDGQRVATKELVASVLARAKERNDEWGREVLYRITPFESSGDFIAEEAKYHHQCQARFNLGRPLDKQGAGRPVGSVDSGKQEAFLKLCNYLDSHDDTQFTMPQLLALLHSFTEEGGDYYSDRRLKQKLIDHYGDELVITDDLGKQTIYTFLDTSKRILRQSHRDSGLSKEDIIDMCAMIISDEINCKIYDLSNYPSFSNMSSGDLVPELLGRWMKGVIQSKSSAAGTTKSVERRRTAISHSIIAATRPRSFISPILLAISTYVNTKLESRELADVLSSLSFTDDYRELLRLHDSLMPTEQESLKLIGDFHQFVFDNADINIHTLTGSDTWHVMGGIAASTPASCEPSEPTIQRSTQVRAAMQLGQFSQIPIQRYRKARGAGLKTAFIGPLEPSAPTPPIIQLATSLDNVWLTSFSLPQQLEEKCPNWSGFMQAAVRGESHEQSSIQILPFINLDPTKPDTIYTALLFAQQQIVDQEMKQSRGGEPRQKMVTSVTFDQPLYAKADDIVEASPEIDRIVVRLGGFHLIMSYMGAVGFIMKGSGIESLWATIYAPKTVEHMLTGHAYARALRGHFITSAALTRLMIDENPGCMIDINLEKLLKL